MPDHLSDAQAADVLRRAALLQARSDHAGGPRLSLDDLKHAAEAAGIEGRFVEQAYLGAGEDLTPDPPFLGIETGVRRVRVVPGRVSEAEWGRIVLALRREIGEGGTAETIGDIREWTHGQTRIQLEPDGPNTRVTARSRWDGDAKMTSVAAMLYAVIAVGIAVFAVATEATPVLAILMGVLALAHGGAAWGPIRARAPKRAAQLDRSLDAIERLAGADERAEVLASAPDLSAPEASGGDRIDPSLLDAEPPSDAAPSRQRLRE